MQSNHQVPLRECSCFFPCEFCFILGVRSFYSSKIKDEFPLVTFYIFHPNPDPTSNPRQNLVLYPVVLAECCVSLCFLALG